MYSLKENWFSKGDNMSQISDMLGKVFVSVEQGDDELVFKTEKEVFKFYHAQDCCESVYIESIVGDLEDLVGSPLLLAEESTEDDESSSEVGMWTFYKFATRKGYVDVRWNGSSNGYYSIDVYLEHNLIN